MNVKENFEAKLNARNWAKHEWERAQWEATKAENELKAKHKELAEADDLLRAADQLAKIAMVTVEDIVVEEVPYEHPECPHLDGVRFQVQPLTTPGGHEWKRFPQGKNQLKAIEAAITTVKAYIMDLKVAAEHSERETARIARNRNRAYTKKVSK